jgi:hypothetical protein
MNKDIRTYNRKGQRHGYQEWYSPTSYKCLIRGNFKNNKPMTYIEWHELKITIYDIK